MKESDVKLLAAIAVAVIVTSAAVGRLHRSGAFLFGFWDFINFPFWKFFLLVFLAIVAARVSRALAIIILLVAFFMLG